MLSCSAFQGDYCLLFKATLDVDGNQVGNENGQTLAEYVAAAKGADPAKSQRFFQAKGIRRVCFYKRGSQAKAVIKFGMCRTGKCKCKRSST
jgi:hypothetical protein